MTALLGDIMQIEFPAPEEYTPGGKKRYHQVTQSLRKAITSSDFTGIQVHAKTTGKDFWYKALFFTPHGVLYSDTGGDGIVTAPFARRVGIHHKLHVVSFKDLMGNWKQYGIREGWRPVGTVLFSIWEKVQGLPLGTVIHHQTAPIPSTAITKIRMKRQRPGYVYLLLAEGTNRVKIGRSQYKVVRIDHLKTASPFPLVLLRMIPSADHVWLETSLHRRYDEYKVYNEWYALPPAVLEALLTEDFA